MGKDSQNAVRGQQKQRGRVNNAQTFVEDLGESTGLDSLFVDEAPPKKSSPVLRKKPTKSKKKKAPRASDRRRQLESLPGVSTVQSHSATGMNLATGVLTCTQGPEEGLALSLIEGSYTIGRARENNFIIKDLAASRKHLQVDVDQSGVFLTDLGSGNGSHHNGKQLRGKVRLIDGDRITLGDSILIYTSMADDKSIQGAALLSEPGERIQDAADALARELAQKQSNDFAFGAETSLSHSKGQQEANLNQILVEEGTHNASLNPADMWKETGTGLGLSPVIPQSSREFSASPTGSFGLTPQQAELGALPRPQMLAPQKRTNWIPIVLAGLLLFTALLAGLWFFMIRDVPSSAIEVAEPVDEVIERQAPAALSAKEEQEFQALLRVAMNAQKNDRHELAKTGLEKALKLKPNDMAIKVLLERSNSAILEDGLKSKALKENAAADAKKVADEKAAAQKAADQKAADQKAADQKAAAQKAAVKKAAAQKASRKKVTPRRVVKKTPPKTQPTSAKRSSAFMDDTKAKDFYRKAMVLVRTGDKPKGCKIIERVLRGTDAGSPWHTKAKNALKNDIYGCR